MRPSLAACLLVALACIAAHAETSSMDTRLLYAAQRGDAPAIGRLLKEPVDLDPRDAQGRTPLMLATLGNHLEAARVLIEAGADVNAKDARQDSPYLYAGASGLNEILRLTLAHGADLTSTNRYGGTALIHAAERGHVQTVQLLIHAGVEVNHLNRLHWTALLEAVILGDGGPRHVQIVRALLDAGADPAIADKEGVTALEHAKARGFSEMAALLEGDMGRR